MSVASPHRLAFVVAVLGIALLVPSSVAAAAPSRTLEGRLVVVHGEEYQAGSTVPRAVWHDTLVTDSGEVELTFRGARPVGFLNGARVRIRGTLAGATLTAGPRAGDSEVLDAAAAVTGVRKLAVLLVKFSPTTIEPWTPAQAAATVFTAPSSIASYFSEESYGLLSLTGAVFGYYTISINTSTCNYQDIGAKARAAASAAGVNLNAYTHIQYAFPKLNSCGWAGLAQVPGRDSWINNALNLRVSGHELSHNFGVHHASTLSCSEGGVDVAISVDGANCSSFEYGDPFSIMGSASTRHTHTQQLASMGWITGAGLKTIATSGVYSIGAAENAAASAPRGVRVSRGDGTWFYLELRQPFGTHFDNFGALDPVVTGVTIRVAEDWGTIVQSQLIDTRPATDTFTDAPLAVGETFVDPLSGATITTVSISDGVATVSVALGVDHAAPSAPGSPAVTAIGPSTVRFSWSASTDDIGVTGYRVSRNGAVLGTTAGTHYDNGGIVPLTPYQYSVVALDAAGHESDEATKTFTMAAPDVTPPTTPANLHKTKVTYAKVKLAWNAASDAAGVAGYRVYRNGKLVATTTALKWTGERRTRKSTYWVVAFDAASNLSGHSNSRVVKHR